MKKILPLLVITIFVPSGLGAVAIPSEKRIENKPAIAQTWALEITIKGGILGYQLIIENVGNEPVNGSLTMNITTDAWIMVRGGNLKFPLCPSHLDLSPGEKEIYNPGPVIGFGPATITIVGEFAFDKPADPFQFETNGKGFIVLMYTLCNAIPITLP
jgi:hypothetical protein